jgi:DNA-binding CsgD family transcriptional regulator
MSHSLSTADLHRMGLAADALLSPLAGPSPEAWRAGVSHAMRELFGVDNALFVLPDGPRVRFYSDSVPTPVLARFDQLTRAEQRSGRIRAVDALVDTWFQRRAAMGVEVYNEPLNDSMLDGQLHRSTIVNEAVRPGGMYDFLGFMTACAGSEMMLFMGHDRPGGSRFGSTGELQVLRALLPAFRAGHHALAAFGARRAALSATLDAMSDALLVVGPDGRPVHRNAALGALLAGDPQRERLERALSAAARSVGGARQVMPNALAATEQQVTTAVARYAVRVMRMPPELLGEPGGALVSVTRAEAELPAEQALAARFGLTRRETEVALALARRLTNAEVALALGISPHTAERHTERVLAKLGVRSRHDVAACLQSAEAVATAA